WLDAFGFIHLGIAQVGIVIGKIMFRTRERLKYGVATKSIYLSFQWILVEEEGSDPNLSNHRTPLNHPIIGHVASEDEDDFYMFIWSDHILQLKPNFGKWWS
ncbi:hypothetical protein ACJX0J_005940, partial [Zea mays]